MSDTTPATLSLNPTVTPASVIPPSRPPAGPTEPILMKEGLPSAEVRRLLGLAARRHDAGARQLAFYLVEMEARRLHQETGHDSTAFYAEARLGLDRRRTSELLRIGRLLLELGDVDRAFCDARLSWSKVLILASVITPKHEAEWLERALALDCRALAALARTSKPGGPPRKPGNRKGLPEIRFPLGIKVGAVERALVEQAQAKLAAELDRQVPLHELLLTLCSDFLTSEADGSVPGRRRVDSSLYRVILRNEGTAAEPSLVVDTDEGALPVESQEALLCDVEGLSCHGEGHGHDHSDGHVAIDVTTPPELRRMVLLRDGVRCRACRSRRELMAHHIEYRAAGGPTTPENLIALCSRCHGLVHTSLLVLQGETADAVRFADRSGAPLVRHEPVGPIEPPTRETPPPAAATAPAPAADPFDGMVERDGVLARVKLMVQGARARGLPFPHMLITGAPGTGKTRLARTIAAAMGRTPREVSGATTRDRASVTRILASLEAGDVLLVDEAHALPRPLLRMLRDAVAESRCDELRLPPFTLVAATAYDDELPRALCARFLLREQLEHWDRAALGAVVRQAAAASGVSISDAAVTQILVRAAATPLDALRLLELVLRVLPAGFEVDERAVTTGLAIFTKRPDTVLRPLCG
jgi:hypothetical protein